MKGTRWGMVAVLATALAVLVGGSALPGSQAEAAAEKVPVLIAFDRQPGPAEEALVRGAGGNIKYTYQLVPAIAASLTAGAIDGLIKNPKVTAIDPDGQVHAIDAELDNAWGVKRIGSGTVHYGDNKGAAVKVAVIDSGIDYTHPDLDGNYVGGYDFVNDDPDPMDDNGHGTHVAGTVAAEDNEFGVVGVAPEASLYGLKVLSASGGGSWSDIIAALQWAVDNGIHVTNNSYGSSLNPGGTVQAAFDNSSAAGVLHVAAAGNTGNPKGKGNNVGYPARFDSVIAVAATDSNDNRASFSSTGDTVELAAPGVVINSTKLGGGYVEYNGTSMASPHVAGTAALVIAAGIADVRTQLQTTADDLGDPGRDELYGFGLVDADEAAAYTGPPPEPRTLSSIEVTPASASIAEGQAQQFTATASFDDGSSADLTSTATWASSNTVVAAIDGSGLATGVLAGTTDITASQDGVTSNKASLEVTAVTSATTVSVSSITYGGEGGKNSDKHLLITVALQDNMRNVVGGASVSIDLLRDGSFVASGTGTTGTDGTVTWILKNAESGCYTTAVTNVSAGGLAWDPDDPANTTNEFCKSGGNTRGGSSNGLGQ